MMIFFFFFCSSLNRQLLSKPKFSGVEKIKTIGSTYMAAAGLSGTPVQENNQVEQLLRHTRVKAWVRAAVLTTFLSKPSTHFLFCQWKKKM